MLLIYHKVMDTVRKITLDGRPKEVCGILWGSDGIIRDVIPVSNVAEDPHHSFYLDPREWLAALKILQSAQLDWYGVFHSHPQGTVLPSTKDMKEWHYPDHLYAIAAVQSDHTVKFHIYKANKEGFEEIPFEITHQCIGGNGNGREAQSTSESKRGTGE